MALKKSQLYSSLWQSCDELRGGMDASQYKDYVLTLLFMKYVSDKHASDPDALIEVPDGGGFDDMAKLKGDKEIGDRINKIISKLAEANELKGVIDQADFNDESKLGTGKEMQDRLSKLVAIFEGLDFRANRVGGDDLLGDAYEYLMRHFATESGKSKGQFYTPAEVSRIMAKVVGIGPDTRQDQTIYDPTCGSGSLLLKAADEAPGGITVYGQEMDNATWSLARMNLILHGHETADIWRGNTLAAPYFKNPGGGLKTFDFAVANPPFSAKAWSNGLDPEHDEYGRFAYGVPPTRNGDYAFLLHLVTSLKSRGKGAIILPHGVLFRGNREADIRRNLVRRGLIKGIIGLPANLFYGTGIPACIVVVDKEGAAYDRDDVAGLLKDRLKQGRERLEETREAVKALCEPVEPPRDTPAYLRYFCAAESGNADQLKENEPKRLTLYKLAAAYLRAFANLANEMEAAGYSRTEAQEIRSEVNHFEKVRSEVKLASGDYIDLKMYEPAMRHLLDTYIRADESKKVSAFDELPLVQLIIERGESALASLPENIRRSEEAMAETIENNVRRLIIDEMAVNPKYYEEMSTLLDALIAERKRQALDYKAYLAKVVELAKRVNDPDTTRYPPAINSVALRALFDNLRDLPDLASLFAESHVAETSPTAAEIAAVRLDATIRAAKMDDWRGNRFKERKVRNAIKSVLLDDDLVDRLFEIVKEQHEY